VDCSGERDERAHRGVRHRPARRRARWPQAAVHTGSRLADGFFVPLFFVVLGARLQLGALIDHPSILRLTVALLILNVAAHLLAAGLSHQRAPAALIATAQPGVPAAVVTLGLQEKVLTAAQGAAIITAALASLGIAALGTTLLAREARQVGDRAASEATAVAERA
jgi:Kef-type K+ transport system membrane component KefB